MGNRREGLDRGLGLGQTGKIGLVAVALTLFYDIDEIRLSGHPILPMGQR